MNTSQDEVEIICNSSSNISDCSSFDIQPVSSDNISSTNNLHEKVSEKTMSDNINDTATSMDVTSVTSDISEKCASDIEAANTTNNAEASALNKEVPDKPQNEQKLTSKEDQKDNDNTTQYEEEEKEETISRRLVEYFVIVSSIPKVKKKDTDTTANNERSDSRNSISSSQPSLGEGINNERVETRRAHLDRDYSGGINASAVSASHATAVHPSSPSRSSPTIPTLETTEQSDKCLEIGESIFTEEEKAAAYNRTASTESASSGKSIKSNFLKSMNEQKKKIQTSTAKLNEQKKKMNKTNASGIQNLEKKLEGMGLDKTLSKIKSMKLGSTSLNSSVVKEEESHIGTVNLAIHPSSSSSDDDSSFSVEADAGAGNDDDTKDLDSAEGSAFRPSNNPTSAHTTPPLTPTPATETAPSVSERGPLIPDNNSFPAETKLEPRGASENIRMGSHTSTASHNEDTEDTSLLLEPVITSQYPPVDHIDQPLNPMITQFCHPHGDVIVPLHEYKMPTVHHFVLTDAKGGKLYGTCLTVYEEFIPRESDIEILSGEEDDDIEDDDQSNTHDEGHERGYVECSIDQSPKPGRLRRRSKKHKYYAPRVLCLLSTWPYLSAFRTYLTQLYRLATTTNLMSAPLERYVLNICSEVPAPPPGSFEVKLSILDSNIRFWAPPADQPITYVSLNYGVLFECLDIGNVLFAWYTLACERKILLVSSQMSLLTVCAEILCSMLFPMRWSHLYIPCIPKFLTPMLDAPMPYLCGVSRENFPHAVRDISDETVVVDLDRNVITMGKHTPDLPVLPHRRKLKLEAALEKHAGDVFWKARGLTTAQVEQARFSTDDTSLARMLVMADAVWDEKICTIDDAFNLAHAPDSMSLLHTDDNGVGAGQSRWDAVQEAFLRFYVSMLKDYRKYMPSTPTDVQSSWRGSDTIYGGRFKSAEFVQSQMPDFHPFLDELTMTQQFDDFVTRRMYNAGDAPDIKFFDQSIDAKRNRSKLKLKKKDTPFLHSANAHRDLKQIDAIKPNKANLPPRSRFDTSYDMKRGAYTYPTWPETLDNSLYGKPRPIPSIIKAEFDRRSALTAMLRSKHGSVEEGILSGSNNPSPEATAFVLFFVSKSTVGIHVCTSFAIHQLIYTFYSYIITNCTAFSNTIGKELAVFEKQHKIVSKNLLDQCPESPSNCSSVSGRSPWKPKVNPPWMANDNHFQSLHTSFSPPRPTDPQEVGEVEVVHDEDEGAVVNDCCAPECSWTGLGAAIDPSAYIGNPWAKTTVGDILNDNTKEVIKSSSEEELECELEKAKAIAKAQVDLGFNTLRMMRQRKLPTESITYKTLIEACGRCGIAHRAQQLMEMMTQDGMALDSEVYFAFIKAFSNISEGEEGMNSLSRVTEDTASEFSANKSTTASEFSANKSINAPSVASSSFSHFNNSSSQGDSGTDQSLRSSMMKMSSTKFMDGVQNVLTANKRAFKHAKKKRIKRLSKTQSLTKKKNLRVTSAVATQIEMSSIFLEDLYPNIIIDTDNSCPKCARTLIEDDIIRGWKPCQVKDFSTMCPSCKHRFIPKFSISCTFPDFEGSQGKGTPLYCDYLSPWVLLQEIRSLITNSVAGKAAKILGVENKNCIGIEGIIDPSFRAGNGINATLWWNLILCFRRYKIPFSYLLQGSYEDQQLIMPSMTDTM